MKAEFSRNLRERIIKSFIDISIITELERGTTMSGYDVVEFFHKEFGILVSPGTVYSILYSLERNQLIRGISSERKRVYRLTEEGKEATRAIMSAKEELQRLIARILRLPSP